MQYSVVGDIITVNWGYMYASNQGKLASDCLQRFSYIFETSIYMGLRQIYDC